MSKILDKLADEAAKGQQKAQERERLADELSAAVASYRDAWAAVAHYAGIRAPADKSPGPFYREAEGAFRRLAAVLAERGADKYLPAVVRAIERGSPTIDPSFRPGELAVVECLRLAVDKTTRAGEIARELRRLAEREPRSSGLSAEVGDVRFFFDDCHRRATAPPERPPAVVSAAVEPEPGGGLPRKGVAARNAKFLAWYEAKGSDTYHSHAKIRAKWNGMTREQRAAICPDGTGHVTRETVVKAVQRAEAKKPRRIRAKRT